jgi:hypothetical protein
MEWQVQEMLESKLKLITGQFNGDGTVFSKAGTFVVY